MNLCSIQRGHGSQARCSTLCSERKILLAHSYLVYLNWFSRPHLFRWIIPIRALSLVVTKYQINIMSFFFQIFALAFSNKVTWHKVELTLTTGKTQLRPSIGACLVPAEEGWLSCTDLRQQGCESDQWDPLIDLLKHGCRREDTAEGSSYLCLHWRLLESSIICFCGACSSW